MDKNRKMSTLTARILFGCIVLWTCSKGEASQVLPSACWDQIQNVVFGCPPRDFEYDEYYWGSLSKLCCRNYPGTVLHCQESPSLFLACLQRITVSKGNHMKLERNASGDPVQNIYPCDDGYFEPKDRQSDTVRFPQCSEPKSTCRGKGQMLLCRGGNEEDDLCICSHDYTPYPNTTECHRGFTQNSDCRCVDSLCPDGTQRFLQNNIGNCKNVATDHSHVCSPIIEGLSPDSSTPRHEVTEDLHTVMTPPNKDVDDRGVKNDNDTKNLNSNILIAVLTSSFGLLVIVAIIIIVYCVWVKHSGDYTVMESQYDQLQSP
ncbi:uncharacterized protein LOC112575090 isoform X3 [Pomacea canaliculata]|uniref:uncharacterized protein LOC112575090 isoform X3 n=1 Tax=Pomacea canaliculata TaxID=400727 RepID=UPI000D73465B|nr:uncharacterized protein LOC112575090 isoform X3 [Pomacea canaliculata]XP_025112443.1 uncharacterized protein LOC112575090 isoform X3 [Pomacea canaliculata]XP_025112444.1 uncharacterized protein LOC112575090 isoform X3 [Pomacea canaliculata]